MFSRFIPGRLRLAPRQRLGLGVVCLWVLSIPLVLGQEAEAAFSEYQVKAAFIYNFAKFVEWPPADETGSVKIGVLGDDPFGDSLDEVVRERNIRGRPIEIHRFRTVEELQICHILFISDSEDKRLPQIVKVLSGVPVLTVGESQKFAEEGGMIALVLDGRKVRFDINAKAAQASGITVRSQLLQLARSVTK